MLIAFLFLDQFEQLITFIVTQCRRIIDQEGSSARMVVCDGLIVVKDLSRALSSLFPGEVVRAHESPSLTR